MRDRGTPGSKTFTVPGDVYDRFMGRYSTNLPVPFPAAAGNTTRPTPTHRGDGGAARHGRSCAAGGRGAGGGGGRPRTSDAVGPRCWRTAGPGGAYSAGRDGERRARLREQLGEQMGSPAGPFTLTASAWFATGLVP